MCVRWRGQGLSTCGSWEESRSSGASTASRLPMCSSGTGSRHRAAPSDSITRLNLSGWQRHSPPGTIASGRSLAAQRTPHAGSALPSDFSRRRRSRTPWRSCSGPASCDPEVFWRSSWAHGHELRQRGARPTPTISLKTFEAKLPRTDRSLCRGRVPNDFQCRESNLRSIISVRPRTISTGTSAGWKTSAAGLTCEPLLFESCGRLKEPKLPSIGPTCPTER